MAAGEQGSLDTTVTKSYAIWEEYLRHDKVVKKSIKDREDKFPTKIIDEVIKLKEGLDVEKIGIVPSDSIYLVETNDGKTLVSYDFSKDTLVNEFPVDGRGGFRALREREIIVTRLKKLLEAIQGLVYEKEKFEKQGGAAWRQEFPVDFSYSRGPKAADR